MSRWVLGLAAAWLGCAGSGALDPAISEIGVQEAAELLRRDGEVAVLDIRTPQEFARGHIANAANIDYRSAEFKAMLARLDRDKPYLMHCASGGRSSQSLAVFGELKFKRVYHMQAGMNGWAAAGLPVARP